GKQACVETDEDWPAGCVWSGDGSEIRSVVPPESCVFRAPGLSATRTARRSKDWVVPIAGNVRAVAQFLAPGGGDAICCLCHEREAVLQKATRHPDSKPILRRTGAH